jgi:hypothetical protein
MYSVFSCSQVQNGAAAPFQSALFKTKEQFLDHRHHHVLNCTARAPPCLRPVLNNNDSVLFPMPKGCPSNFRVPKGWLGYDVWYFNVFIHPKDTTKSREDGAMSKRDFATHTLRDSLCVSSPTR